MSRTAAQATSGAGVRSVAAVAFVALMGFVVLLIVRAQPAPDPFDPRSGQPSGARGLVVTLDQFGADVTDTREVPQPSQDTRVLVLDDRLNDQQRQELIDFVDAGGVVIVADPDSTLHGGLGFDEGALELSSEQPPPPQRSVEEDSNVLPGRCTIDALANVRGLFVPDGLLFPVVPSEPTCFTRDAPENEPSLQQFSFVIVREFGAGFIVGLGDNEPFINKNLRRADNAALAVALLVPERGANVTVLQGSDAKSAVSDVGSGDETLRDLVPQWVWMSLALGAVAFVVFAVSRSTRVGRLVVEPIAAPIAGSELVSATGNLMERAGHAERAGWLLRDHLYRDLCRSHGVDLRVSIDELDNVVALRSGTRPGEVAALLGSTVSGTDGLLDMTAAVDRVRREVFGASGERAAESNQHSASIPVNQLSDHFADQN